MSETVSSDQSRGVTREPDPTEPLIRDWPLAHVAGALGIAGQLAGAYWYLLYPMLVVPTPANYLFFVAWFVLVGLAVAWWRHHPMRSFVVPIVSVPAAVLALEVGTKILGWAP